MNRPTKTDRNIKFMTILAVAVLFVFVLTMITLLVQKTQLENRKRVLQEQIAYYQQLQGSKEDELAKRDTYEWLEQQARELGLIAEGESLFQGK